MITSREPTILEDPYHWAKAEQGFIIYHGDRFIGYIWEEIEDEYRSWSAISPFNNEPIEGFYHEFYAAEYLRKTQPLNDLDVVKLNEDIPHEGLAKGATGTIVHIYQKGKAFEVEFNDGHLVTLLAKAISLA